MTEHANSGANGECNAETPRLLASRLAIAAAWSRIHGWRTRGGSLPARFLLLCAACMAGAPPDTAAVAAEVVWQSGFETGFPGRDWLVYDNGSYTPTGRMPAHRASAWTIIHRDSGQPVFSGHHAYKGWIDAASDSPHRAYPVLHADIPTPLVNTFMVYLDADYGRMSPAEWIHLGTWGNHDTETGTGVWALHTLSVRDRKLEFAHAAPPHGDYLGPHPQLEFPLRRWVRITVYLHYNGKMGYVQVWQDGKPVLKAQLPLLSRHPGTRLRTAHWGMYGPATLDHGIQYNDDIRICRLEKPPANLVDEPPCKSIQVRNAVGIRKKMLSLSISSGKEQNP